VIMIHSQIMKHLIQVRDHTWLHFDVFPLKRCTFLSIIERLPRMCCVFHLGFGVFSYVQSSAPSWQRFECLYLFDLSVPVRSLSDQECLDLLFPELF